MVALFQELKHYVGFTPADEATLRRLGPRLEPRFKDVIERFYAQILAHDDARSALARGERKVGQLKISLLGWLQELFAGPWDDAYVARRARIGHVHVRIALPQHYMITAMNLVRRDLGEALSGLALAPAAHHDAYLAIERILDIDLALMLHTYREDSHARLVKAERLSTYGQLVGSIGHELRNPLGVIETSLYLLRSKEPLSEHVGKHVDRIANQVSLANDIITQLLELIRERPMSTQPVELSQLVHRVIESLARPSGVAVTAEGTAAPVFVTGDPTQLHQVLTNLLDNAIQAIGNTGAAQVTCVLEDERVTVHVDDSGPGVDASVMARLFEPLVTTRAKGVGLGLPLVRRIVERHGGTIHAGRGPLGGARFTVSLLRGEGS